MNDFFQTMKLHLPALLFAILVGCISVAPFVLAPRSLGVDYKGIPFSMTDVEEVYMARIHEILEGHAGSGQPYFFEYKNALSPQPEYGEMLYAFLVRMSQFSLTDIILFSKFLFPIVLYLAVYFLFLRLFYEQTRTLRIYATLAALLVTLGSYLLTGGYIRELLNLSPSSWIPAPWVRPVNPIMGMFELILFLILLQEILFYSSRLQYALVLIAGIILGVAVAYPFAFLYMGAILGVYVIYTAMRREMHKVSLLLSIGVIAVIINWEYARYVISLMGNSSGNYMALHTGLFLTHQPLVSNVLLACFLGMSATWLFLLWRRKKDIWSREQHFTIFMIAVLVASFLVLNMQVILGRTVWPGHFSVYLRGLVEILFVGFLYLLFRAIESTSWERVLLVIGICILLLLGVRDAMTYRQLLPEYRMIQDSAAVWGWLNAQGDKECVVLNKGGDERSRLMIPAYTNCDSYENTHIFYNVPRARILHNYLVALRLQGVTPETLDEYLKGHGSELRLYFFDDWLDYYYESFKDGQDRWLKKVANPVIIESKYASWIELIQKEYPIFFKQDFAMEIHKYRIDYLLWDKNNSPYWDTRWNNIFEEVYTTDRYVIFTMR